jgi:hypothetical protein
MTFQPGQPKLAGRKKGTPNKNTEMLRQGVKSAIEIVREGGMHPVEILMEVSRFMHSVGVALAPKGGSTGALTAAVLEMAQTAEGRRQLEMMRRFFETAANISYKAAEFGCAKLARIDYVADAPSTPTVKNKMIFRLNIDGGQAPGRPVIDAETTEN